jgi:hypothetical protein
MIKFKTAVPWGREKSYLEFLDTLHEALWLFPELGIHLYFHENTIYI